MFKIEVLNVLCIAYTDLMVFLLEIVNASLTNLYYHEDVHSMSQLIMQIPMKIPLKVNCKI